MHRQGRMPSATWIGLGGALLVVLATVIVMYVQGQSESVVVESMAPSPQHIAFVGPSLEGDVKDPVAVRLHNFMVACATGEFKLALDYIDPRSFLAGQAAAACGPVLTALAPEVARVKFERIATDRDISSVYITTHQPQQKGESYIFFMRKLKGQWYFSAP